MLILYASETGTSEDVALSFKRMARRLNISCQLLSMDKYHINDILQERVALFIVSTTGQGDNPESMKKFWRNLMMKQLPKTCLEGLSFAVLALGDSSYRKYNFAGKKLNKRLLQLGANSILDIGLADDQHDLGAYAVIDVWFEQFWRRAAPVLGYDVTRYENLSTPYLSSPLFTLSSPSEGHDTKHDRQPCPYSNHLVLKRNLRLTPVSHWQDVRSLEFESTEVLNYNNGDTVLLFPENSEENVNEFLRLFKLDDDTVISLHSHDKDILLPYNMPQELTWRRVLTSYLDINSIPRKYFWQVLDCFIQKQEGEDEDAELEREKISEFITPEGQDELFTYCNRPRRNVLEILNDFPITMARLRLRLDYVFDIVPFIKPRQMSISASCKSKPHEVHILVAIVNYYTILKQPRLGTCSNWLANLSTDEDVKFPVCLRSGTMNFNGCVDQSKAVILIAPGTGIAGVRGLIQDRIFAECKDTVLIFGCRGQNTDYFYKEEWEKYESMNLLKVITAFSRDQDEKIYVQHRITEHREYLWHLLSNRNASVFVCGNSNSMPKQVREAFVEVVLTSMKGCTPQVADDYIEAMMKARRYQEETWS